MNILLYGMEFIENFVHLKSIAGSLLLLIILLFHEKTHEAFYPDYFNSITGAADLLCFF